MDHDVATLNAKYNKEIHSAVDFFSPSVMNIPQTEDSCLILSMMGIDINYLLKKPNLRDPPINKCYQIQSILKTTVKLVNFNLEANDFRKIKYNINDGFVPANKDRQRAKYGFAKLGLPFVPDLLVYDVELGRSDLLDYEDDNLDFTRNQLLFYQNIFESSTVLLINGLNIEFLRPIHSNQGSSLILKSCLENANKHHKPSEPPKVHIAGVINLPEIAHTNQSDESVPNKRLSEYSESPQFNYSMMPIRVHISHSSHDIKHGDQAEEFSVSSDDKTIDN
ncbi:unnamed protein product [Ambrosiozyma monospora]|uniref:Unnamed protein product n=1 Tax=Ambrosiozyma monospora TaxID=43982 RepID=A0ACB5T7Q1_AMBMO|nr:unnamed protein product [Ambrosiozyma monospora]